MGNWVPCLQDAAGDDPEQSEAKDPLPMVRPRAWSALSRASGTGPGESSGLDDMCVGTYLI